MKDVGLITAPALAARLLPTDAVLACLAVALVVGTMAWAWTYLTTPPPAAPGITAAVRPSRDETAARPPSRGAHLKPLGTAVRVGLLGGAGAIGLAAFVLALGPASVSVLLGGYGVAAMTYWLVGTH